MIKVGLTGNIGSGKTTVTRLFEIIGIPVYNADLRGRAISQYPEVIHEIKTTFGFGVLDIDGLINRKALAAIVFKDPDRLQQLNAIIHPRVKADFIDWCNTHSVEPYVIQESAILFESGLNTMFDKTIMVTAPEKIKLERVMNRDNVSERDVLNRMANQWSDSRKVLLSDFAIINDGKTSLIEQVLSIHRILISGDFISQSVQ